MASKNLIKIVAHPETGEVFTPSRNADKAAKGWGTVRVDARCRIINKGLMTLTKRTAFLGISLEAFTEWGIKANMVVPGTIVRIKSHSPFYKDQDPVMNPETGEVTLVEGRQFYQNYEYTDELNVPDSWIINAEIEEDDKEKIALKLQSSNA